MTSPLLQVQNKPHFPLALLNRVAAHFVSSSIFSPARACAAYFKANRKGLQSVQGKGSDCTQRNWWICVVMIVVAWQDQLPGRYRAQRDAAVFSGRKLTNSGIGQLSWTKEQEDKSRHWRWDRERDTVCLVTDRCGKCQNWFKHLLWKMASN